MLYAEIVKSLYDGLKHNHYDEWVIKDDGIVISQPMLWKTEFMLWKTEPKKVDMSEIVLDHFRKHYDLLVDNNGIDELVSVKAQEFVKEN